MKTVDELRFDLNVKLEKFRRFRIENGHINNSTSGEKSKKGFFKKIFSYSLTFLLGTILSFLFFTYMHGHISQDLIEIVSGINIGETQVGLILFNTEKHWIFT